ncbi:phage antirepressor N-terminal domain-containing protein [Mycobacteroides abscessus]|uniref:phage antirepressor N-terminal domain-containing protein n=1 Tax=Mycobacteroides abscessus TaxID=36809 RepID=UPI000C26372F|nr:phage antirepressor N-terminal domain-containing protein [Mycobacteroides abscessus]RIR09406.1 phage antirepressor [Mycobacteroides abscessus]RIS08441.1 phage antirepressor [Mycobacteroides abscessus]
MSIELASIDIPGAGQLLALDEGARKWVAIRPICDRLGIDPDGQRRKLDQAEWAVTELKSATGADGKSYQMVMLDADHLPMWLATIQPSRVSETARSVLVAYQREAAKALRDYFYEGGAINPNATQDQLGRIIGHAREQMSVVQLAKGVIDPKHLEAKARIILARALGEAPEIAPQDMPLYVWDYLREKGLGESLIEAKASGFGKRLKALFIVEHDRAPQTHPQSLSGGRVAQVCSYTEADRPLFDKVWARHYANVVAA